MAGPVYHCFPRAVFENMISCFTQPRLPTSLEAFQVAIDRAQKWTGRGEYALARRFDGLSRALRLHGSRKRKRTTVRGFTNYAGVVKDTPTNDMGTLDPSGITTRGSATLSDSIFFQSILPKVVRWAQELPKLFPEGVPLLLQGRSETVYLSHSQVRCLMSGIFLCLFPSMSDSKRQPFPDPHFLTLFESAQPAQVAKLRGFLEYFRALAETDGLSIEATRTPPPPHHYGCGGLRIARKVLEDVPAWECSEAQLSSLTISQGGIEKARGCLQVDFANKFIGGGVLAFGCVQEEIRFALCPELLVTMLLCACMEDHEAIEVRGVKQYSEGVGYGSSFRFLGPFDCGSGAADESTPTSPGDHDWGGSAVVAIDALRFGEEDAAAQCDKRFVDRELAKLYTAFRDVPERRMATGNWGCGVFNGDLEVKAMLQLIAASVAGRELVYHPFDQVSFGDILCDLVKQLKKAKVTAGQLYNALLQFPEISPKRGSTSVFDFVRNRFALDEEASRDEERRSLSDTDIDPSLRSLFRRSSGE